MTTLLTTEQAVSRLREKSIASRNYAAMYSSWLGGITKDPALMVIPIDDHGFHRGDAVFEALKCVDRKVYALERHLDRLEISANHIGLKLPCSKKEFTDLALETIRVSGLDDSLLRFYVSRGPGGFTANPYESIGAQVYLVVTTYKSPGADKYANGVSAKISQISVKDGIFANVKSCNYLPNVLMKKEAVDAGVDFTVSRDESGNLAEGSTENFAIVDSEGKLVVPGFERTLKGVTVFRMMELSRALVEAGVIKAVAHGRIRKEDVLSARETFFVGTTLDCLPVTKFEGQKIGDGVAGPVAKKLLEVLRADLKSGPLVTPL
jgi:branched-subunit amino acid aminotransferase/4-amino-4-deoxychorismate lyase